MWWVLWHGPGGKDGAHQGILRCVTSLFGRASSRPVVLGDCKNETGGGEGIEVLKNEPYEGPECLLLHYCDQCT